MPHCRSSPLRTGPIDRLGSFENWTYSSERASEVFTEAVTWMNMHS